MAKIGQVLFALFFGDQFVLAMGAEHGGTVVLINAHFRAQLDRIGPAVFYGTGFFRTIKFHIVYILLFRFNSVNHKYDPDDFQVCTEPMGFRA